MSVIRLPLGPELGARVAAQASMAVDGAILLRLAAMKVTSEELRGADPVDPGAFWGTSRVLSPASVQVAAERPQLRSTGVRILDVEGESSGPGDHAGARRLQARAYLNSAAAPNAPMVLILHGYAVPAPYFEDWHCRRLVRRGFHAMRMDLPFHMRRRMPGVFSGDGFFSSDLGQTRAVVRQAVEDAAALVAWARHNVTPNVAVMGVSLGGLAASLLAATVELDAALLVIPACELPEILLDYAPGRVQRRLGMSGRHPAPWGDDRARAREILDLAMAPVVPRQLHPVTEPNRIALISADHDRIVGSPPVQRLAKAWDVECWTYPRGHITLLSARGLAARMHAWLIDTASKGSPSPSEPA